MSDEFELTTYKKILNILLNFSISDKSRLAFRQKIISVGQEILIFIRNN